MLKLKRLNLNERETQPSLPFFVDSARPDMCDVSRCDAGLTVPLPKFPARIDDSVAPHYQTPAAMLNSFFWILTGSIVTLAAMQLLFIAWYRNILQRPNEAQFDSDPSLAQSSSTASPEVAIALCLRGPDPTLPECLTGLLNQHYSNFNLHLIVDSDCDPAIPLAKQALKSIASPVDVHWHTVTDHNRNRSLKCSALLTVIQTLKSQEQPPEIIALVDADALVAPDWLNRLVTPLLDTNAPANKAMAASTIGATTGNRWFEPTSNNLGSRFRAAWNAAAVPQMQIYRVAWGGSLALKLATIEQCDLLKRWSQAFCEDTMLSDALQANGLHVYRVPELIMVNQESTTLKSALGWIGRQLLTVRLHHRVWPLILLHAILGGFCFFTPLVLVMITAIQDSPLAIWTALIWLVQLSLNVVVLSYIRKLNLNAIQKTTVPTPGAGGLWSKLTVAIALQATYPFLAIGAAFRQRTRWRGIEYRISRQGKIEMLDYVPYSLVNQADQHSIH